jgi:hypothetical protein
MADSKCVADFKLEAASHAHLRAHSHHFKINAKWLHSQFVINYGALG